MKTLTLSLLAVLFTQNAFAAANGTLSLSGVVDPVNDIVITANGSNNTSLSITSGESGKNVASVAETSNNLNGYKIFMYSSYAGELRNSADSSKKTTYTISYGGGSYNAPPASSSPLQVKNVSSLSAQTTNTSAVLINVSALSGAVAGTYSDTLTISIQAN